MFGDNINIDDREITLVGFVYEIEERGWVKGIGISTGDEAYIVEMNEVGEKLRKEIENDVQVTGIVTRDSDGKNRILVTGYEVLHLEDSYNADYHPEDDDVFSPAPESSGNHTPTARRFKDTDPSEQ